MIKLERSRQIDEQYIAAYTKFSQTDEELADLAWQSSPDLARGRWHEVCDVMRAAIDC